MMFFSCASSLRGSSTWRFDSVAEGGNGNQLSSIENMSDSQRITERSITFCNSRIYRAADEAAEIARLHPSPYYFGSAIQSTRFASRFNEAKSWLAKADDLRFDNLLIRRKRLIVAFATGDRDKVEKILKEEERGSDREDFLHEYSLIEIQRGRFHSAERLRLQALGPTSKASNADWWAVLSGLMPKSERMCKLDAMKARQLEAS